MIDYAIKPNSICRDWVKLPELTPIPEVYEPMMGKGQVWLAPGYYDQNGQLLPGSDPNPLKRFTQPAPPETRVVIEYAGVNLVWGVFAEQLAPGEQGEMTFENTPGSGPITPFFNEWDKVAQVPRVTDAFFALVASMRGKQIAKVVGVNTHNSDRWAAAGMIVSQMVEMPTG
jgi:hypothetical protein